MARDSSPGRVKNFPWFMHDSIVVGVHNYALKLNSVFWYIKSRSPFESQPMLRWNMPPPSSGFKCLAKEWHWSSK
jgi:hypothetical protein